MIYITQLIYLKEGQENVFNEFESHAIPLLEKHRGRLLQRIRPQANAQIEGDDEMPYEIHLVTFPDENDFQAFMQDDRRLFT